MANWHTRTIGLQKASALVTLTLKTLSLRNFWHPFSHSVRNFFDARKITGMVTKMGISRLVIKLDIKAVHHWNCE